MRETRRFKHGIRYAKHMNGQTTMTRPFTEVMKLDLPEIDEDGIRVSHFTVSEEASKLDRLRGAIGGHGRYCPPGTYTRLHVDGKLWMSDTPDEMRDHTEPYYYMARAGGDVLVNGLGTGMIVKALLSLDNVEHIDVVELDERVIKHIGQHYDDPRVTFHHDDALTIKWPKEKSWTYAWHDIWPNITADNLPDMHRLHRRYGRRTTNQGSWARWECERQAKAGW